MTQLTDKMEGLRANYVDHICRFNDAPQTCECYGLAVDDCLALVKAEAVEVGDWEAKFDAEFDHIVASQGGFIVGRKGTNFDNCATGLDGIKDFITTLLAAKDNEIAEAYKKGFIDGGLSK